MSLIKFGSVHDILGRRKGGSLSAHWFIEWGSDRNTVSQKKVLKHKVMRLEFTQRH